MTKKLAFALTLALAALAAPLLAAPPAPVAPQAVRAIAVQAPAPAAGTLPPWSPSILPAAPQAAPAKNLDALLAPPSAISCPPRCTTTNCNPDWGCSCLWVGWCVQCEC